MNLTNLSLFLNISNGSRGGGGGGGGNFEMPLDIILIGSFFYIIVFLTGLIGNLSVIYVLMKVRGLRNFTNYLLANLSIADLLVLIACVPSGMHDLFAKERWYLGKIWCYMVVFIENCMGIASLLSIFIITLERYYVICRPLKLKSVMTQSTTLKLILLIWSLSITINLPFIYMTEYRLKNFFDNKVEYICVTRANSDLAFFYSLTITFVIYFAVGVVLLGMYYKITTHLRNSMNMMTPDTRKVGGGGGGLSASKLSIQRRSKHQNNNSNNRMMISKSSKKNGCSSDEYSQLSSTINNNNNNNDYNNNNNNNNNNHNNENGHNSTKLNINNDLDRYVKPRKQLIMMLMCVILSFYVCLSPLKIWTLVLTFAGGKPSFYKVIKLRQYWYISIAARFFFYANSSINPILYNFMSRKFRNAFTNMLIFRLCCSSGEKGENDGGGDFKKTSYYNPDRNPMSKTSEMRSRSANMD